MKMWELFVIAVGLSMDAFAVSVCKGLSVEKVGKKQVLITGAWFGGFQAFMPLMGYLLGSSFRGFIESVDHWIAFVLLVLIGANMIWESRRKSGKMDASFAWKAMLPLAVATSIDALAVGVTFAFLKVQIVPAVCFIGIITFILSAVGIRLGKTAGCKYESKAEFAGGLLLVLMGVKILLQHTGILTV